MARWLTLSSGAILAAAVASCDSAPGARPLGAGPILSDLRHDPQAVVVDDPGAAATGRITVPMTVSARAGDPDGDLLEVRWFVRGPDPSGEPVGEGVLSPGADGRFEAAEHLELPVAVTGRYTVVVYASDRAGHLSNELRGAVDLLAIGSPPRIEGVEMPDRVARPAAGEPPRLVGIVVTVSDPDGLANVLRVETLVNGRTTLYLCDDGSAGSCNAGSASGDATAGDGRFTLTLQVDASNSAGSYTFVFTAKDRSGLASEPVTRQIVIE